MYKVREGDTLYSIAWGLGADYRDLAEWNDIAPPYTIFVGQRLRLRPGPKKAPRSTASKVKIKPLAPPERKPEPPQLVTETYVTPAPQSAPPLSSNRQPPPPEPAPAAPGPSPSTRPATAAASTPSVASPPREFPSGPLDWQWPADGQLVESFDRDNLIDGIRIAGEPGQAVFAAESGQVVYANAGISRLGLMIIIKHNADYFSAYSRNGALFVEEGQWVEQGAKIAEMGLDPKGERGLLHFEIRLAGDPVDPEPLLGTKAR